MQYDAKYFVAQNPELNSTIEDAKSVQTRLAAFGMSTSIFANAVTAGAVEAPYVAIADLINVEPGKKYYLHVAQQLSADPADVSYHDAAGVKRWLDSGEVSTLQWIFGEFYPQHGDAKLLSALLNNADVQKVVAAAMKG